jgi:hypothetical protein
MGWRIDQQLPPGQRHASPMRVHGAAVKGEFARPVPCLKR